MTSFWHSLERLLFTPPPPGSTPDNPLKVLAAPGLATLLDTALFDAHEAQLTGTLSAAHALLQTWLQLRRRALGDTDPVRQKIVLDGFQETIDKLSLDKLAQTANLSDPFFSSSSQHANSKHHHSTPHALLLHSPETGRRRKQRPLDCWETSRLLCPDAVWAEELVQHQSKWLQKHPQQYTDVAEALVQFQRAMASEAGVLQRLYLVKTEYRAPLRAFWEAHQSVQRAPLLTQQPQPKQDAKEQLQALLEPLTQVESLQRACHQLELTMAQELWPVCEVARWMDPRQMPHTLQGLRGILNAKQNVGLKPLLLDWQGVPRDGRKQSRVGVIDPVEQCRTDLDRIQNELQSIDIPEALREGCASLDPERVACHFADWLKLVQEQHSIELPPEDTIRQAELQWSLAAAPEEALVQVARRLELIEHDKQQRWKVLCEVLDDWCWRELHLCVELEVPDREVPLPSNTSALGVFGEALQWAGETLPIG